MMDTSRFITVMSSCFRLSSAHYSYSLSEKDCNVDIEKCVDTFEDGNEVRLIRMYEMYRELDKLELLIRSSVSLLVIGWLKFDRVSSEHDNSKSMFNVGL